MNNKTKKRNWLRSYFSWEIAIEYKACLYFFCLLSFYCGYLLLKRVYSVRILFLVELICTTYFIGYLQVYVFHNFDESDHLRRKELFAILFCTGLYTAASVLFNWFDRGRIVTWIFFGYVLLSYFCAYLVNKIKKKIDTENLNDMLTQYKYQQGGKVSCENGRQR